MHTYLQKNIRAVAILACVLYFFVFQYVNAVNFSADADVLALFDALFVDDVTKVQELLRHKVNPNGRDAFNRTPLLFAALNGSNKTISLLIDARADLDLVGNNKLQTPLMVAIDAGHAEITALLLKNGATTNIRDTLGRTALWYAVELEDEESVALLLENGANPNIWDKYMQMPLMEAARIGSYTIVALLVEAGASLNVSNFKDWTALMLAADGGYMEVAQVLVEAGASINLKNNRGQTAMFLSDRWNYTDISILFRENGGSY